MLAIETLYRELEVKYQETLSNSQRDAQECAVLRAECIAARKTIEDYMAASGEKEREDTGKQVCALLLFIRLFQ